ncbi:TIGR03668 family PPOX class F420-dependent oxidoreductase [Halorubellus sp. JP-L1]|uniref:TIGR03668 family PPOX class F420-dependent oxidoreductase n=1 Tax=Halorubellus sp. JP-L1 TaxID=2715753 RepID=UPI0014099EC4|nr:TIGR03668 family PPOX class F420-dependent oxidoreductase [Halorubellus sp. JP-L1]NHN42345.1 TIGR03668 family PPOX class F420-dependent oxidoreductase [Halorubellus sp. JP-L1]
MFDADERAYLAAARVARLATADADGRPHAVPICFALHDDAIVTAIDEKPKANAPDALRRVRDVTENPHVAIVVDHYHENWDRLGWLEVLGTATVRQPDHDDHHGAVTALRDKYERYHDHDLDDRPLVHVIPGSVHHWGTLEHPDN